jgi:IgGFc binding protein
MRVFVFALALAACGPSSSRPSGEPCTTEGVTRCDGNVAQTCHDGVYLPPEDCPNMCVEGVGCAVCVPGAPTCNGDVSTVCQPDGQGYTQESCDPRLGLSCNVKTGLCEGPCSRVALGRSYIGCEYYPTIIGQQVNDDFQFAVAIGNTSAEAAQVTIDGGALTSPLELTVAPGGVETRYLPWVAALKLCSTKEVGYGLDGGCYDRQSHNVVQGGAIVTLGTGAMVAKGAYHLRSTRPVAVYQYSPLDYRIDDAEAWPNSYTNDASLLLPTNAWTGSYLAAAWPAWNHSPGVFLPSPSELAVTATKDDTHVTLVTSATTEGGRGSPVCEAGVPQTVTLQAGDVVELTAAVGDLTGTRVDADQPVQVVAGHFCTQVPIGYTACDHLEESMLPVEALSTTYIVTAPYLASKSGAREEITRVVATAAATTVTFEPPVPGVTSPQTLARPGDFLELGLTKADYQIKANHKILVAQYMIGQNAPPAAGTGDPSMTLAVPDDQYRDHYLFHAPTNYESNYVNITAPVGETVKLDGSPVPLASFTPIGSSGFAVARVKLANGAAGNHSAEASMPFGISVYGYGQYTSYWYPGGLDVAEIFIP